MIIFSNDSKYWLRLMHHNGWIKWLDCSPPTWTNWESIYSGSDVLCANASPESLHRWRIAECNSSLSNLIICEKEQGTTMSITKPPYSQIFSTALILANSQTAQVKSI